MANNYIAINQSSKLGAQLVNATSQVAYALDALRIMKKTMMNMTDAVDFTVLEAQFGLTAGKGTVLYALVFGAVDDMEASGFVQQLSWNLAVGR
jgi:hypothetical protein